MFALSFAFAFALTRHCPNVRGCSLTVMFVLGASYYATFGCAPILTGKQENMHYEAWYGE